ncbi:ArsR/SmtB family transcription factor [Geochorda subterranea]|uniref:Metalloregulator ArsR/SmtB family transcription factor n=1 Tax=Geochorda subterranea TaxID=3109564 RepID=A0ABZ1BSZ4_9FIRM|nr:metalloregulator ArsR/SmtB family transcription factor [Limnochorda sp. LNt]WRP15735.1 metalloregulator ArsR/SmtB family transcription factor [Limnochorda sp. LNt]
MARSTTKGTQRGAQREAPEDFEALEDRMPTDLYAMAFPAPDMTEEEAALWSLCFRALGDGTRLRILAMVVLQPFSVEPRVIAYRLGLKASAVSYHLRVLAQAGFIESRPSGSFVHCRALPDGPLTVLRAMGRLTPRLFFWGNLSNPVRQRDRQWEAWRRLVRRSDNVRRRGRKPAQRVDWDEEPAEEMGWPDEDG